MKKNIKRTMVLVVAPFGLALSVGVAHASTARSSQTGHACQGREQSDRDVIRYALGLQNLQSSSGGQIKVQCPVHLVNRFVNVDSLQVNIHDNFPSGTPTPYCELYNYDFNGNRTGYRTADSVTVNPTGSDPQQRRFSWGSSTIASFSPYGGGLQVYCELSQYDRLRNYTWNEDI